MTVKPEFIVQRQGRSFVLYAGLLDLGHSQGLRRVTTRLIQIPAEDNGQTAICHAEVETERGTFSGIGDASPANVSRAMVTATIRLAETRAKARALRDAVNVGVAAFEELGDDRDELTGDGLPDAAQIGANVPTNQQQTRPRPQAQQASSSGPAVASGPAATEQQVKAIYSIGRSGLGLSGEEVEARSLSAYGEKPSGLSRAEASALIGALQAEQKEAQAR